MCKTIFQTYYPKESLRIPYFSMFETVLHVLHNAPDWEEYDKKP